MSSFQSFSYKFPFLNQPFESIEQGEGDFSYDDIHDALNGENPLQISIALHRLRFLLLNSEIPDSFKLPFLRKCFFFTVSIFPDFKCSLPFSALNTLFFFFFKYPFLSQNAVDDGFVERLYSFLETDYLIEKTLNCLSLIFENVDDFHLQAFPFQKVKDLVQGRFCLLALQLFASVSKLKFDDEITIFFCEIFIEKMQCLYSLIGFIRLIRHSSEICIEFLRSKNLCNQLDLGIRSNNNDIVLYSLVLAPLCFDIYDNYDIDFILLLLTSNCDVSVAVVDFVWQLVKRSDLSICLTLFEKIVSRFNTVFDQISFLCKERFFFFLCDSCKHIYPYLSYQLSELILGLSSTCIENVNDDLFHEFQDLWMIFPKAPEA